MTDYRIVLLFSIALILTWLAIIMYRRSREHLYFSLFVFSVGAWSFTLGMMYLSVSTQWLDFWGRMVYVSGSIIPVLFYYFSIVFANRQVHKGWFGLLFLSVALVSYIYLFTPLFVKEVTAVNGLRGFVYGNARLVFDIYFDLIFFAGFLTLSYGLFRDKSRRVEFIFITIGTLFALLLAAITNIVLPLFNRFEYLWAGPVAAAMWAAILTYGILRHRLLNTKVIATEIFAGTLWALLLVSIFFSQGSSQLILNVFLFLASILIGGLLIQSVLREVEQREELERLSGKLADANAELRKLDQAKSEFVSIASHQLRAPLTVIRGYISMFLEGTFGKIAENGQEALSKVAFSAEQLIKLVDDLLNLSRIEAGKMRYTLIKTNILDLIQKIVEEFRASAAEKNIKLDLLNSLSKPVYLYVDVDKIREVVVNLISNGLKYASQKVDIEVEDIGNGSREPSVRLIVKDDGIGIKAGDLPRIFTKFSRTPEAQKKDPNGMGIGLYFVKRIVEDHGGKVRAESTGLGKGSTFVVDLPLNE